MHKEWYWFLYSLFLFNFINKSNAFSLVLVTKYRNLIQFEYRHDNTTLYPPSKLRLRPLCKAPNLQLTYRQAPPLERRLANGS